MEAALQALEQFRLVGEVGDEPVEVGQAPAGVDGRFGRAVVARAGDELEELVYVVVHLQDGVVVTAGGKQGGDGEALGGEVALDGVGEGDVVEVVLAARAAFEQVLALVGDDDGFWGAAVAADQGLDLQDDADVVVAHYSNELFGRKLCAASGHNLMINDK